MEVTPSEPTPADIFAATLKASFAPLVALQRDIRLLTQGISEFRQDLLASLAQTSQILNEGLKASSEAISSVQDALKQGAKLTLDFDRIMTDIKIDKKFTAEQTAAAQERIQSLAQSTGRTSGEIAQIIKTNIEKMGEDFLKPAKGASQLEVVENHAVLYCLVGDSCRVLK